MTWNSPGVNLMRDKLRFIFFEPRLWAVWVAHSILTTSGYAAELPEGFVYLKSVEPTIVQEIRYAGEQNFLGRPVVGYKRAVCIVSRPVADALVQVQKELSGFGLGLKIFDAYRPQRAVDDFVVWASDFSDQKTKPLYYPKVNKKNLFKEGYIAKRSSHSRGGSVDVTLVSLSDGSELDMGTAWDYFDVSSWPESLAVTGQQRANRFLLQVIMMRHGFLPLKEEWWHFKLENEPHPDTYFDFPVE